MKADRSPGEARPAATADDTVVFRMPEMDATLSDVPPRQPRRLGRRASRRRWEGFSSVEVYCLLDILKELDRRHQFARGIEPERSLMAELERECRRRGIVGEDE
ncbi:MAG TPA: hypothetical protein VGH56_00685 [Solirubrobacteraceae bacterium]|jgi:hypothetical protein